jgi:predicted AAA+ superfamily ATPase
LSSEYFGRLEKIRLLEKRLLFGSYPEITITQNEEEDLLQELAGSYLYRDLLTLDQLRKPAVLDKLLQALALQVGSKVSFQELSRTIEIDNQIIERYIDLLEKAFVIFRLPAFSRNLRNEIRKGKKFYFYDNGIRNAVINNFSHLQSRSDVGVQMEPPRKKPQTAPNLHAQLHPQGIGDYHPG